MPACHKCDRPVLAKGMCPTHYSEVWRAANAEKYTKTCSGCGVEFKTWRKTMQACDPACASRSNADKAREARKTYNATRSKGTALVKYLRPRVWLGTTTSGRAWVQGSCGCCGEAFIAPTGSKYCTPRCKQRAHSHRRYRRTGKFSVPDLTRAYIYQRDNNTCQLCMTPVDTALEYQHMYSATLDHIIPQSVQLDHSIGNLRLAHRICNIRRGNRA